MLVTLSAEHWSLWTTYKFDWQWWLLGNCQLKVSNDRQCRLLVSVFKFTNIGSNSRVWMPGGSEDKDGGQGRCRYQWYTNTTHWLCSLTATIHERPWSSCQRRPNTKQALWRRRKQLGEATVDKSWAKMDSLPPVVKHGSRRRTETRNN